MCSTEETDMKQERLNRKEPKRCVERHIHPHVEPFNPGSRDRPKSEVYHGKTLVSISFRNGNCFSELYQLIRVCPMLD